MSERRARWMFGGKKGIIVGIWNRDSRVSEVYGMY
jgi:hypothetical protein